MHKYMHTCVQTCIHTLEIRTDPYQPVYSCIALSIDFMYVVYVA